ncbi:MULTISPECIES: nuclear transport factor 2 family protein [unclassified Embleya]|uniref:nuclear transport factor 2 family protein n=1 Tax=unclassified Embleya TaxID=2699296 RepID=UPI00340AF2BE
MPDEVTRKALALEYCRRMNAGDVEGVLELFAPDVVFEDPVGSGEQVGRDALRAHITRAIVDDRARERPGTPVAAHDGETVVLPATIELSPRSYPKRIEISIIGIVRFRDDGLVGDFRALWGDTDMRVLG